MTIATRLLLLERRSHTWRSTEPEPGGVDASGLDQEANPRDSSRRYGHHQHHHRAHDGHGRNAGKQPTASRHSCRRRNLPECDSVGSDNSVRSESGAGNGCDARASSSRVCDLMFGRHKQLPGAVLQARARLLERLRGLSLSENRQTTIAGDVSQHEIVLHDGSSHMQSGNWEAEIPSDIAIEPHQMPPSTEESSSKPPGVCWEALCTVFQEVFKLEEEEEGDELIGSPVECPICLENFKDADGLIRLHCGHRFHPDCLEPWVRTCGDCPYCRASIEC